MADLAGLLQASLSPTTRKLAEQSLDSHSTQPGFLPHLLQLVLDRSQDRAVRLAGAVYLKNLAKLRWEEVRFSFCLRGVRVFNFPCHQSCRISNPFPKMTKPLYDRNWYPPSCCGSLILPTKSSAPKSLNLCHSLRSWTFQSDGVISSLCVCTSPIRVEQPH
jgi:hypothetical protein